MIREAREDAACERLARCVAWFAIETFVFRDAAKLLGERAGFTRSDAVHAERAKALGIKARLFGVAQCAQEHEEIARGIAAK